MAQDLSRLPGPGPLSLTGTCNFCPWWDVPVTVPSPAAAEDVRTRVALAFCVMHALAFCRVPFEDMTPSGQ